MKKILITGAAGYIGTHVLHELLDRGYTDISVIDRNLATSPNWIGELVGGEAYNGTIQSRGANEILSKKYDAVIHLAADISVEESTKDPVKYWRNNLMATSRIIDNLKGAHLIFASTGTAFCPDNAYAYSKVACEEEITSRLDDGYTIFRFFNVSGLRKGIHPTGTATHVIRRAAMAALGLIPSMTIAGDDWGTPDGSCVRDYIHVEDLAASIVNAVEAGPSNTPYECLGTGKGYSVKEVVISMKDVTNIDFDVIMAPRRSGDVASMICPLQNQYKHISITRDLDAMCLSAYEGLKCQKS